MAGGALGLAWALKGCASHYLGRRAAGTDEGVEMMEWNSRLNFLNLRPWLASSLKPRGIRAEGAGWFTVGH